jgi:hypothetical protein
MSPNHALREWTPFLNAHFAFVQQQEEVKKQRLSNYDYIECLDAHIKHSIQECIA